MAAKSQSPGIAKLVNYRRNPAVPLYYWPNTIVVKRKGFPYCIPDKRALTETELALLIYLLKQVDDISVDTNILRVVARCGCGACPTILFGQTKDDEPITSSDSHAVMDWAGRAENGTLVGIGIFMKDGIPTELEAWSVDGGHVENWPSIAAIERTQ